MHTGDSSREMCLRRCLLRICIRAELIRIAINQVDICAWPRNCPRFLCADKSASWTASSASAKFLRYRKALLWRAGRHCDKAASNSRMFLSLASTPIRCVVSAVIPDDSISSTPSGYLLRVQEKRLLILTPGVAYPISCSCVWLLHIRSALSASFHSQSIAVIASRFEDVRTSTVLRSSTDFVNGSARCGLNYRNLIALGASPFPRF
jgi:hypothetical protein